MKRLALIALRVSFVLLATGLLVLCALLASCSSQSSATGSQTEVSQDCAKFDRHQYEVCFAYVVNNTLLARVPFYKLGRNPDLGPAAKQRFESRYYGTAQRQIEAQAAAWPVKVEVKAPEISIVGGPHVTADLSSATISTVESWLVTTRSGRVLFKERGVHYTITLRRVPTVLCVSGGGCLHKWVVANISPFPG